ncbi:NADPH-dependent FMN reductase [Telmatospirillum siberiense]|uniref:NADPH-dependent FMN reductase n=1 Tax=Telmatospirillum siberiense TaxID=382514 RepID=A0A2N3PZQ0_9PROT|nr:NAD(P)H-dependent oxidoreductase [Telmatospirillum siberiense]PKU25875.1 NADPH-dependent FMN reductase [Telmatospirillum siberiense]
MPQDNIRPIRLLGLSGSLRRESHNTAVLNTVAENLGEGVSMTLFPLNDLPLYNQDDDDGKGPAAVLALRRAIADSDGLIVSSPEFNYGIPGVLKNALDWASRPYGQSSLIGKPAIIITVSPAFTGGVRAQSQIQETLEACMVRVVLRPQVVIGSSHEKIKEGRLTDAPSLAFALAGVDDLLKEISLLQSAKDR